MAAARSRRGISASPADQRSHLNFAERVGRNRHFGISSSDRIESARRVRLTRAHQLDPLVPTSVAWTYRSLGDFQAVLDSSGAWDGLAWVPAMVGLGRRTEAIERLQELEISGPRKEKVPYALMWAAYLEGDLKSGVAALEQAMELVPFYKRDPEARFILAEDFAMLSEPDRALEHLPLALDEGYRCHYALVHHREWDCLRDHSQFKMLIDRAAEMSRYAKTLFLDNTGDRLLGVPRSTFE